MSARAIMIMGTGSDAGKSLVVAGLCRAFKNRGLKVAPYKPQNMSNNAAVTADGGEIGRAQALQARACGLPPITAMNPLLLKPERETGAQVILRGKRIASMRAKEYFATRAKYLPEVVAAFDELAQDADLVIVEGAGSASEINLRENDLANFGFARAVKVPVVLLGDIQRGGVIGAIVGSLEVIAPEDAELVVASIINKFQGDTSLFESGMKFIAERTQRPCLGPVPFFHDAAKLPAEDVLGLDQQGNDKTSGGFRIALLRLGRIANFDDLDPLRAEPGVDVHIVQPGSFIPRDIDLIIIPGSKATRADMEFMRVQGWDIDIQAHVRAGGAVLGICGGYQMLGHMISDPNGIEGETGETKGLGLLDVTTVLENEKQLSAADAVHTFSSARLTGYHMHLGVTQGTDCERSFARVDGKPEGATSANGRVMGTYLHGLFAADEFRQAFLTQLGGQADETLNFEATIEATLDALAKHLETYLDLDELYALAGK